MAFSAVAFYVVAHQDDWQLFRGLQAYNDLQVADHKIVFIHTTAGDAGLRDGWWEKRERGAVASVQAGLSSPSPYRMYRPTFLEHQIQQYVCGNGVLYFLRLASSDGHGEGYPPADYECLSKLRDQGKRIRAIDGSTVYESWEDFCATMQEIVKVEAIGDPNPHRWINASDFDPTFNPGDHDDHKATSDAVRSFAHSMQMNRAWFRAYASGNLPANLFGVEAEYKKRLIDAYFTEVSGGPMPYTHKEWLAFGNKNWDRQVMHDTPD